MSKGTATETPKSLPRRQSAAPGDSDYLLRDLDYSPVRFRLARMTSPTGEGLESQIIAFLQKHPGATLKDMHNYVPALGGLSYEGVRTVVLRLVNEGILKPDGTVPLEEVDHRYERVPACDLCGSPSEGHKVLFWKYNTPVVRCSDCGLMYANPRWKAEHLFGRYTPEYWQQYADAVQHTALDHAANQARWNPYLSIIESVRQTGRLLDVGCATGEFLLAAKASGWETYGVETSPIAAAHAERLTGSQIHVGTLDTAPYPDAWFDAVLLSDVIEHVQSPRAYLMHIARLLRPGGMFVLTTPNIRSIAYWVRGRDWWVVGPNDHLYYFSPRTLVRLLTDCGFRIHHMHTWDMTLANWLENSKLRWVRPLLRLAARPITERLLLGDGLFVVARRG